MAACEGDLSRRSFSEDGRMGAQARREATCHRRYSVEVLISVSVLRSLLEFCMLCIQKLGVGQKSTPPS